ncbi:hypothetical protein ACOSQ3_017702 [Xanthoceras sorbifolium]
MQGPGSSGNLFAGTMEHEANASNLGTDQQNLGSSSTDASIDNGALLTGDGHDQVTVNEAPIVQAAGANSTFEVAAPEEDVSGLLLSIGDYRITTTTLADPQAGNSSEQQRAFSTAENTYADGFITAINRGLLDSVAISAQLEGAPRPVMYLPSEMPPPLPSTDQVPADQTTEGQGTGDHPEPQPNPSIIVRDITMAEYREILLQQIHIAMVLMQRAERARFMELLSLQQQIGIVTTGLTPDSVMLLLRQRKYQSTPIEGDDSNDSGFCCICQEEFAAGEEIATLDCGHDHHAHCISQWLVLNNSCPICKARGLAALPG